jgi:hypothetical protein
MTSSVGVPPATGSVKRRLTWPETWGSQDEEACGGGKYAGCGQPSVPASPVLESPPLAIITNLQEPYMMQSPIIDRAVFLNGKRKARVLFSPAAAAAQPLAAAEEELVHPEASTQQHAHPSSPAPRQLQQLQQQGGGSSMGAHHRQLSAAVSSSRASLDVLFKGIAVEHLAAAVATAAAAAVAPTSNCGCNSPATPSLAAAAPLLPAAPHKDSPVRPCQAARQLLGCRAARALSGLAPSSEADVLQMRSWLDGLEARC